MMPENNQPQRGQRINLTKNLTKPNAYAVALDTEFKEFAFNEERAPINKGKWREVVFKCGSDRPIDVEIGTGAGMHFAYQAILAKNRFIVGLELKYKPLIQSIRRVHVTGQKNAAICRFHAFDLDLLFAPNEINNVYIHCPDPWVSPRKPQNRVVNRIILNQIYEMQRAGSFLEFKTDSREYFIWSLEEIKQSKYRVEFQTMNLYKDGGPYLESNFQTSFEKIFVDKGIEINYIKLIKD